MPFLLRRRPRVALVFACIKDPSGWLAMAMCRVLGTKVALLDDSWLGRDQGIGSLQRLARRIVYNRFGDAFVGTSRQTLAMFRHYNSRIVEEQCFLSHLVADNDYFESRLAGRRLERRFDVMFSGRIVQVKNPAFFAEVCAGIKARLGACRVLIIGEGEEASEGADAPDLRPARGLLRIRGFHPARRPAGILRPGPPASAAHIGRLLGRGHQRSDARRDAGDHDGMDRRGRRIGAARAQRYVLPLDVEAWASARASCSRAIEVGVVLRSARARPSREFNYDRAAAGILDAFAYLERTPSTPHPSPSR